MPSVLGASPAEAAPYAATPAVADIPAMHMATTLIILMSPFLIRVGPCWFKSLLVQQRIELRPNLILLGLGHMAVAAFFLWLQFGRRRLRLMVVEVEVPPASSVGVARGVLHSRVRA